MYRIGVVITTAVTLDNNIAQARLNALVSWRGRAAGRRITAFVPRETASTELMSIKDADQVVYYPVLTSI